MTNESLNKIIEISDKIKWCDRVKAKSGEDVTFTIECGDSNVIPVPKWLKDHIIKMADKYREKLVADLERVTKS